MNLFVILILTAFGTIAAGLLLRITVPVSIRLRPVLGRRMKTIRGAKARAWDDIGQGIMAVGVLPP